MCPGPPCVPVTVRAADLYLQDRDSPSSFHCLFGSENVQQAERGASWARLLRSCRLPHPMLMASLRPVMNEVSEQETGEGQTYPLPTSYPIQTLCLPSPCSRQALPARTPPQTNPLLVSETPLPSSTPPSLSVFLTSRTARYSDRCSRVEPLDAAIIRFPPPTHRVSSNPGSSEEPRLS